MEANDMKAMREALTLCYRIIHCAMTAGVINRDDANKAMDAYHAALAKPYRACDVMSQEDLTKVVISGFMKSLGIGPENQLVSQLVEAAISAAIKCAYDTQLVVKKGEGACDGGI